MILMQRKIQDVLCQMLFLQLLQPGELRASLGHHPSVNGNNCSQSTHSNLLLLTSLARCLISKGNVQSCKKKKSFIQAEVTLQRSYKISSPAPILTLTLTPTPTVPRLSNSASDYRLLEGWEGGVCVVEGHCRKNRCVLA